VNRSPLALFDHAGTVAFANASWRARVGESDDVLPHVRAALREQRELEVELPFREQTWSVSIYPIGTSALVCIETTQRALGQRFVEVVAHELRTPIATMALWVDVLRVATSDDVRARAAGAIAESCTAQTRLVGELLDLSRALAGRLQIDRRPIASDPLLRDSLDAACATAAAKQIVFDRSIAGELGSVFGDASRIRQIVSALLDSAMDRTPTGGVVTLSARRTCDAIEIHVRDSSPGATPQQLATLFEPFGADATSTFGLQLSLAHHLVRLHGGTLVASSEGIDRGMQFALVLPTENRVFQIA
jgi:signal transduction histidine kinase